jgi:hypothetical protein
MTLAKKIRKLATDCSDCRAGFCCGRCLCCMPEEAIRVLVQKAQDEDRALAAGWVGSSTRR